MPTPTTRRLILLAGVLLYWGVLFVATHLPGDPDADPQQYVPHLDKLAHAAAFAGLAVLVCLGSTLWWRPGPRVYLSVIGILAVYAALDEITQGFVSYRESDPRDWIADVTGTLLGVGLFAAVWAMRSRRAKQA